jgi:hypothetical protein
MIELRTSLANLCDPFPAKIKVFVADKIQSQATADLVASLENRFAQRHKWASKSPRRNILCALPSHVCVIELLKMILETIYSIPALVFLAVVVTGWYVTSLFRERAKLAKLGGRPVMLPYKLPFGVDTLWETLQVRPPLTGAYCRHPNGLKISTL